MSHDRTEDRIRNRAYELWYGQGCPDGLDAEHWRQACDEIGRETSERAEDIRPESSGAGRSGRRTAEK